MAKGFAEILKDPKILGAYDKTLSLEKLKNFFLKRNNSRQGKYYIPHKLTWEETQAFTNFTKEEYENSSGLYILSNGSLTGKGGWDLYMRELTKVLKNEI